MILTEICSFNHFEEINYLRDIDYSHVSVIFFSAFSTLSNVPPTCSILTLAVISLIVVKRARLVYASGKSSLPTLRMKTFVVGFQYLTMQLNFQNTIYLRN